MADFNKFKKFLQTNDYTVIEYFSYHKYCYLVKVMHVGSGFLYMLNISRNYRIDIPDDTINHYTLSKENIHSKEFTSRQLSEYYPMIQIDPEGEEVIEDISDKLKTNYKQPIVIHNHSAMEHIDQMKRLRYCFKLLEYKLLLQTDQHMIRLTPENSIEVFKIENYPKTKTYAFYIVATLEQMYSRINNIHDTIQTVESEFYSILDLNQEKHNEYLHTNHIEFFIHNNDKLLGNKKDLHRTYGDICKILKQVQEKENECLERLNQLRNTTSSNSFRDADLSRRREELEKSYEKIHTAKLQVMEKLLKLSSKIKNMYLNLDQLGFNLSLSFNELRNELYKMLL